MRKIGGNLLVLAIILLPLNNRLPYFGGAFGELASEGAFYPLALGLAVWGIAITHGAKIHLSDHLSARVLGLFVLWVVLSIAANLPWIATAELKGRSGAEKALLQLLVLTFCVLVALFTFDYASRQQESPLYVFRRWALVSFLGAGLYAALEIASLLGVGMASTIFSRLSAFIHPGDDLYLGRVRSLSGEASWFAMYCGLILPWFLSYLLTERKRGILYVSAAVYLVALTVLTWSRTAYGVAAVELVLFVGILLITPGRVSAKRHLLTFVVGVVGALLIATATLRQVLSSSFSPMAVLASLVNQDNISNVTRFGSQSAAYGIALDHPLFGVGVGQYGFHMPAHMPLWARVSDEIQGWMSVKQGTPWAPVHNIYARIAAETGGIGLILWLALWCSLLVGSYRQYRRISGLTGYKDTLGLALVVSIVGVILSGLNFDSFRFFGQWLVLGLAWDYLERGYDRALLLSKA